MSHMVIYRGSDGKPGYQQAEDIHDAVTFVEQMRNEDGVEHARIFRLEEVVFEYRPYFRVELSSFGIDPQGGAQPAPVAAVPSVPGPAIDVSDDMTVGHDEAFEVVEPAIDMTDMAEMADMPEMSDLSDADAVAGNGARRGLFGR